MTEEQALALARLVASVDGLELGERVRCAQRSRRGRSSERVWSIGSELYGPGPSLGFEIDDRTGAVLSKMYVGFGPRASADFGGEPHSSRFSVLERELFVPSPPATVFEFFADAANVAAISAPTLELVTRLPHRLATGSVLDWQLRSGKRVRPWQLRTTDSIVGQRIDESQVQGPFQHFRHLLLFCAAGPGTLLRERVEYRVPGGTWGQLIGESLLGVKRAIEDGLELRYAAVSNRLGQPWPNGV
jgi:ligand-binding SRPBCC domain-containing protein